MTRLIRLGLAGIAGLAVAAAAVVLLMTRQPERAPEVAASAPAAARDAVAPPEPPATPPAPVQGPQGPSYLQLPLDAVARDLTAAQSHCHRINAMGPGLPAVLTLELEARDSGGLVVVDVRVASRGGASDGLVACASQVLLGRRVAVGSFPPGERFLARYEVMAPSPAVMPPPQAANPAPEPPPMPLPVTRQQLRRRGGTR